MLSCLGQPAVDQDICCFHHSFSPTASSSILYLAVSYVIRIVFRKTWYLVDVDTELAEVDLGGLDLVHQLLVRLRHVVKGKNAEAETEQKKGAERNEGPERKLFSRC